MSHFLYNPPNTAGLAIVTAFILLFVMGAATWRGQRVLTTKQRGDLYGVVWGCLASSFMLGALGIRRAIQTLEPISSMNRLDLTIAIALLCLASAAVYISTTRRNPVATAMTVFILSVVFTVHADTWLWFSREDGWALTTTVGWGLTATAFVALVATVATIKIKAYGQRMYQKGQLVSMDTVAPFAPPSPR